MSMFADAYEKYAHVVINNNVVTVHGQVMNKNGDVRMNVMEVISASETLQSYVDKTLVIFNNGETIDQSLKWLRRMLNDSYGDTQMEIGLRLGDGNVLRAEIASSLRYHPTSKLLAAIMKHPLVIEVRYAVKDMPVLDTTRRYYPSA